MIAGLGIVRLSHPCGISRLFCELECFVFAVDLQDRHGCGHGRRKPLAVTPGIMTRLATHDVGVIGHVSFERIFRELFNILHGRL
jgi:hypothetical protein